jgi:hypothetical protein
MRKLILTPLAVAALTLAPAGAAGADEGETCGGGPVTATYHEVHEVPEPVAGAVGLGEPYEIVAHDVVECAVLAPTGL